MTSIAVIANYCSLLGTAVAAFIAFGQQRNLRNLLKLSQSTRPEDEEIVKFFETNHKGYFLGMTSKQLCIFWSAIGLLLIGRSLFAYDATLTFFGGE